MKCLRFTLSPALLAATLLLTLANPGLAVKYIQANESKELFKIEKIPLQINRMAEISQYLITLARRDHQATPAEQRATAQLLALAMRLDPSNQEARELNRKMAAGHQHQTSTKDQLTQAKARLRFYKQSLAHPDMGAEAHKLADLLEDATKVLNPGSKNNQDLGNWRNTVPSIDDYRKTTPNTPENPPATPDEKPKPTPSPQAPSSKSYHITKLHVYAPLALYKRVKYKDTNSIGQITEKTRIDRRHAVTKIQLNVQPSGQNKQHQFVIPGASTEHSTNQQITSALTQLSRSRHPQLPSAKITLSFDGWNHNNSNQQSIAAAIAVMLEASATNQPLRENLHIYGSINPQGEFLIQNNFWSSLQILRKHPQGGRLIIPKSATALASQILVNDEPDFFTRWEVFAVENLDQAIAVATRTNPDKITQADALFASIQKLTHKSAVTKLAINRAVRARLTQITDLSPNHFSAQAILLQGSGKRPMRLSTKALAHTLLPIVNQMRKSLNSENTPSKSDINTFKKHHEQARASLDPLARIVDRGDRELYQETVDLANDLRSLHALMRRAYGRNDNDNRAANKIKPEYRKTARESHQLLNKIRVTAGLKPLE